MIMYRPTAIAARHRGLVSIPLTLSALRKTGFAIAPRRKKALKTIAQEGHRRACLRLDKASEQRRTA
jgi:hypothetical protein